MSHTSERDRMVALRRDLHRRPEPAWREFWTTCRIIEELEGLGLVEAGSTMDDSDEAGVYFVGRDALAVDQRMAVPDDEDREKWFDRARNAGAQVDVLERLSGGTTGAVAVVDRGEGPTIGLRVDIDGLVRSESDDEDHVPARAGFRSHTEETMHACGHDGHTAIGIGVLRRILASEFAGTFKVFFQPAEEVAGGGKALARSGHLDDVDYLLAIHLGLDHPTGEVVAGIDGFLAVSHLEAEFFGDAAHAGNNPQEGHNAVQALAVAVENLYAIPRHDDGATRINVGRVEGGTATNIIPEHARLVGEVRGETTALKDYMNRRAHTVIQSAAAMYECDVEFHEGGEAPGAKTDDQLRAIVADVGARHADVDSVLDSDDLGGSEDATYLMREVQQRGGLAAYVCIGTDHPGGHHTATFDIDEASLLIGVDVITEAVLTIANRTP